MTNFYSPCHAGCTTKTTFMPPPTPGEESKPIKVYEDCSCVLEAWQNESTSLSKDWIRHEHLANWDFPSDAIVNKVGQQIKDEPITDAFHGWCPVECEGVYKTFMLTMFILMVLGSTGRIGNLLVALRSVAVEDKSLSMAFNVVFMSLLAMLPAPMVSKVHNNQKRR